jgi:hypothetical protein
MLEIRDYRHYLDCIKKWDSFGPEEQELLGIWYRHYYSTHKEKEQLRYRNYYKSNKRRKLN